MKALVVFDSKWGNTESVARAIAKGIGGNTRAARIGDADSKDYAGVGLLVIGSPVLGGRPSKPTQEYVNGIAASPGGMPRIAVFDTRMTMKFAQRFGHAAVRMADQLKKQGLVLIAEPKGFIVKGQKGPLAEGEIENARQWGMELAKLG
jgi:flavodoxin